MVTVAVTHIAGDLYRTGCVSKRWLIWKPLYTIPYLTKSPSVIAYVPGHCIP